MKNLLIQILLFASFFGMGQAIKFHKLGGGLENNGYMTGLRTMFYDTLGKKLYVSGQFKTAENKIVWGAAVWNGNIWDSLDGGFTQYPQQSGPSSTPSDFARTIIRYQNKIYFGGGQEWVNGKNQYNLGIWNGTDWDYPIAEPPNGPILNMIVYNNILYACGDFTKFGNTTCNYIAKFDGTSWQPVGDFTKFYKTYGPPAQINALQFYNNELYLGGGFSDSTGMPRNIAKFDGANWLNVGTGIRQGGINSVFALQEFNNKLYIGGRFSRTQEIPGESLTIWNGNNYQEISSYDIDGGQINLLRKHKNKLFAMGAFSNYGPYPAYGLFYIDTLQQCTINGLISTWTNTLNYNWVALDFIGDSLIVGGLFKYLDTLVANNIGAITDYENNSSCLVTSIKDNIGQHVFFKAYPNPVKDKLNLEFDTDMPKSISIFNALGQLVFTLNNLQPKQVLDLNSLPNGLYYLKLESASEQTTVKIMKE